MGDIRVVCTQRGKVSFCLPAQHVANRRGVQASHGFIVGMQIRFPQDLPIQAASASAASVKGLEEVQS